MKRYRIVRVEAKNIYFKIQKKNVFGWWDLRKTEGYEGIMWTELITFKTQDEARKYIDRWLKPVYIKETVLEEFAF
jgi:hypothetical protein